MKKLLLVLLSAYTGACLATGNRKLTWRNANREINGTLTRGDAYRASLQPQQEIAQQPQAAVVPPAQEIIDNNNREPQPRPLKRKPETFGFPPGDVPGDVFNAFKPFPPTTLVADDAFINADPDKEQNYSESSFYLRPFDDHNQYDFLPSIDAQNKLVSHGYATAQGTILGKLKNFKPFVTLVNLDLRKEKIKHSNLPENKKQRALNWVEAAFQNTMQQAQEDCKTDSKISADVAKKTRELHKYEQKIYDKNQDDGRYVMLLHRNNKSLTDDEWMPEVNIAHLHNKTIQPMIAETQHDLKLAKEIHDNDIPLFKRLTAFTTLREKPFFKNLQLRKEINESPFLQNLMRITKSHTSNNRYMATPDEIMPVAAPSLNPTEID